MRWQLPPHRWGVALVPHAYIEKELASGTLVTPWPESVSLIKSFCLVKPVEKGINETALQDFEQWLLAETGKCSGA